MRRKKRAIQPYNEVANDAYAAAFSLYRGFLNSQSASDTVCASKFMCEGSALSSNQGKIGKQLAFFTR